MSRVNWSDYLGNNATALEIVRRFNMTESNAASNLADWCEAQHADIWTDEPVNVVWDDVAASLLCDAVDDRLRAEPALAEYRDVFLYDWTEGDAHRLWVATAPTEEIVSWARRAANYDPRA